MGVIKGEDARALEFVDRIDRIEKPPSLVGEREACPAPLRKFKPPLMRVK